MSVAALLQKSRVVLKNTTHPGNIGATARAMKTMGVKRLYLAAPHTSIDTQARALAAAAADVLAAATLCETLPAALAECTHVFAYTARNRDESPTKLTPRRAGEIAARLLINGGEVAFLFGGERSGLANSDLTCARYAVSIPVSSACRSLNLAQAVQIAVYELRQALLNAGDTPPPRRDMPAQSDLALLSEHCRQLLTDIHMPKRGDGGLLHARLHRLLIRAEPDLPEVRMLRGVLTAARKCLADEK